MSIAKEMRKETIATLAYGKKKLYVKDQLNEIKIIFGGGGHCEYPYRRAVMQSFSCDLFRKPLKPDVIGLPFPPDLELKGSEARWMSRISVAYGLSFVRDDLALFTYPKDVSTPKLEEIWPRRKKIPDFPEND